MTTTTTFRDAYGVLQRHAETLRTQREPNIDDLLSIVTESVAAYKVCRERIEAVESALEQALGSIAAGDEADAGEAPATPSAARGERDAAGAQDDVPF